MQPNAGHFEAPQASGVPFATSHMGGAHFGATSTGMLGWTAEQPVEEADEFPVDGDVDAAKKGVMRIPDAVDILAKEGRCIRYDQNLQVYTVTNGDAFLKGFCALRITRGKKDDSQMRPFAGMHRFYTILQGEKWASNGTMFRKKDTEDKQTKQKRPRAKAGLDSSNEVSSSGSTPQPPQLDASSPEDDYRESSFPRTFPETVSATSVLLEVTGKTGGKELVNLQEFIEVSKLDELYRQAIQQETEASKRRRRSENNWWSHEEPPLGPSNSFRQTLNVACPCTCATSTTDSTLTRRHEAAGFAQQAPMSTDGSPWWDGWQQQPASVGVPAVVGGLWNASSRGDQAYFFRRKVGMAAAANGSIVRLVHGVLEPDDSPSAKGLYMVVSDLNAKWKGEPIPTAEEEKHGHWCCFLGQVPVTVEGPVRCGEPIAPKCDGSGRARAGTMDGGALVGVALEDKEEGAAAVVKVLCFAGLGAMGSGGGEYAELVGRVLSTEERLEQLQAEVAATSKEVEGARVEVDQSKRHASALQQRLDRIEKAVKKWRPESRRMRVALLGSVLVVIAAAVALGIFLARTGRTDKLIERDRTPIPQVPSRKKMLLVGLEGVPGSAVRAESMPSLWGLMSRSSAYSLSTIDKRQADWPALLSGSGPSLVAGDPAASVLSRLPLTWFKASVVRQIAINQVLTAADYKVALETDAEVVGAAVDLVVNGGPGGTDLDALFVQLGDGDASAVGSDAAADEGYLALLRGSVDANLRAILDAVVARPTYGTEDWLVVVVAGWTDKATPGGSATVPGLMVFHALNAPEGPHEGEVVEMTVGDTIRISSRRAFGSMEAAGAVGGDGSFTVEALLKISVLWQGEPNVVGMLNVTGTERPWSLALSADRQHWLFTMEGRDEPLSIEGGKVSDGLWHHVAVTVDVAGQAVWLWQDGEVLANASLPAAETSTSGLDLVIGDPQQGWHRSLLVDHVRVWSTTRRQEQLVAGACVVDGPGPDGLQLDSSSLAASLSEQEGLEVVDVAGEVAVCNARTAVQIRDVVPTILCHLSGIQPDWGLDGRCWLPEHHPNCNDTLHNGVEDGVDCGGNCSAVCAQATCFDRVQNQGEEMPDCGGPCVACSCTDGIMNGDEEHVDCGGSVCPLCCDVDSPCTGPLGKDYRGCARHSVEGDLCQRWDSQFPHAHSRTAQIYPDAGLVSNYCRNPDNEPDGPWCYTLSAARWSYCTVECQVPPKVHCENGAQDLGEEGVDCGGPCRACDA